MWCHLLGMLTQVPYLDRPPMGIMVKVGKIVTIVGRILEIMWAQLDTREVVKPKVDLKEMQVEMHLHVKSVFHWGSLSLTIGGTGAIVTHSHANLSLTTWLKEPEKHSSRVSTCPNTCWKLWRNREENWQEQLQNCKQRLVALGGTLCLMS